MRRLLQPLQRRMVVKVFAAVGLVVGAALVAFAVVQLRGEVQRLEEANRQAAKQIADLVVGGIEHAMLQGDGIAVKKLVGGFQRRVPDADIHIYDRRGLEVFSSAALPPPPAPESLPPGLAKAWREATRVEEAGRVYRPIPNEERCHACHDAAPALRGVLALRLAASGWAERRERVLVDLVRSGFVHIMTARQSERLDDYFAEITSRAPSIRAVGVYDREGDLSFGKDVAELPREKLMAALQPGAATTSLRAGATAINVVPLAKEKRCAQCHKDDSNVRGVLVVALADAGVAEELEGLVDTSLRVIMMSSLGRLIVDYLDEVGRSGAVDELALYDAEGRVYYEKNPPAPAPRVARALASESMPPVILGHGRGERVMMALRLANEDRCITCHGDDHAVRGVVTVSLPNDQALMVRTAAVQRTSLVSAAALVAILLLLYYFLRRLVEQPVREIGVVADAVGQGNLGMRVSFADPEGDEIKRLGSRMNDMIHDLKTKFVLERFVSKGAARAAAKNTQLENVRLLSERRHMIVLFSDIRGFTAFSETVTPEVVVGMLNRLLQAQAEVVERWQGEIDKFVGDEVMAVFNGEDAARRAVRCAVEMIEAVAKAKRPGQELAVGVGISAGDVVYGSIGSQNRLDFTVIGDVVNTGARLCSAAQGGQVICARAVVDDCRGGLGDIEFSPLPPIQVKNKREPLEIYVVERVRGGQEGR